MPDARDPRNSDISSESMSSCNRVIRLLEYTHVVKRTVRSHCASLFEITILTDDRCDSAGAKPRCPSADKYCQFLEEMSLVGGRFKAKKVREYADDGEQFFGKVTKLLSISVASSRIWLTHLSIRERKAVSKA